MYTYHRNENSQPSYHSHPVQFNTDIHGKAVNLQTIAIDCEHPARTHTNTPESGIAAYFVNSSASSESGGFATYHSPTPLFPQGNLRGDMQELHQPSILRPSPRLHPPTIIITPDLTRAHDGFPKQPSQPYPNSNPTQPYLKPLQAFKVKDV